MIIRNKQMAAFQDYADKDFEDRAVEYLQKTFPQIRETFPQEKFHSVFRLGRERAEKYRCFGEQGIVIYLYLMFILGSDFDSDPQLPWAGEILKNAENHEITRMETLWQRTHWYARSVNGKENENLNRALLKIRENPLLTPSNNLAANFNEQVSRLLKSLFLEKYVLLDEDALAALIQVAAKKARQYGISDETGVRLMIVLMFIFGSGFDKDPLQTWAAEILRDENIKGENQKVSLLREEALKHLKFYLPTEVR